MIYPEVVAKQEPEPEIVDEPELEIVDEPKPEPNSEVVDEPDAEPEVRVSYGDPYRSSGRVYHEAIAVFASYEGSFIPEVA